MQSANKDSTLMYAMRIVMESGLLYAADMLILLIVYSTGSNGAYPMTVCPSFCLVEFLFLF